MWNLKYGINQLIHKIETDSDIENKFVMAKGQKGWGEKEWEFGISRGKLLYIERINNKVLLYSIGNYIQYPVTNHNGKEYEQEYIYTHTYIYIYMYVKLSHFSVQRKLTQQCKSAILQ